jgi:PTS system nitrogen regulatory IIA component
MRLSVKDVAGLLNVPEETVYRWIKRGAIPCYRVNEQFRFNRAELLEWATAQRLQVSPALFLEGEASEEPLPNLAAALQAGGVEYQLGGHDQPSVLRALVALLKLPEEVDREFLNQVLQARETLGSTGIGDGIAIPHVRNPVVLHLPRPTITLCFLAHPIDFGALDGQPVNTLFTLISPTVRTHLHLLSRLGFALRDQEFKALLKGQAAPEALLEAVRRVERALPFAQPR